jgi:hypothetical protein
MQLRSSRSIDCMSIDGADGGCGYAMHVDGSTLGVSNVWPRCFAAL